MLETVTARANKLVAEVDKQKEVTQLVVQQMRSTEQRATEAEARAEAAEKRAEAAENAAAAATTKPNGKGKTIDHEARPN